MATYPFPFLTASPPFPYAATYPYPPPASAYAPPPGFFPAPAYGPSTFPSTTTSSRPNFPVASGKNFSPPAPPIPPAHHTSFDCAIPSRSLSSSPDSPLKPLPVLSSSKFYGDLSLRSPPCGRPKLQQHKEGGRETEDDDGATMCYVCTCQTGQSGSVLHPATPDFTCQGGDLTKGNSAGGETISDEKFVRKHTGPGIFPMSNAGTDHGFVTHQALQGELSKLSNLVSQFAAAMGMQTTEAPLSTGSSPAAASTQFRSPAISPASPSSSPCDASFAVPTPTIAYVSATSPSTVPSATAYTALHVFGEMPQQYDFHNLSRKTVLLADGTERSYFTLLADYPLEQAVPEPVFDIYDEETEDCSNAFVDVSASTTEPLFSNEFVDVLASTPDQQLYEEEQPETEHSSACLNISSNVWDFTLELLQQDDERACNCSILKASDSLVTRSTQLGEHSMRQLRLQWNPGVHTTELSNMFDSMPVYDEADNDWQHSTLEQLTYEQVKQESDEPPKCFSKASETASLEVTPDFACANAFDCILEQHHDDGKTYGCQPLIVSNLYAKGYSQFSNTRVKGIQMVAYNSIRLKSLEAFSEYYSEVFNRDLASNFTAEMSSDVVLHDPGIKRYAYMYSWLEIFSKFEKPLQFTQGTVPLALRYQLTMSSTTYIWDPGVKISLYSWLNILTVWSASDKQLSCTHIPDLAAWPNQSGTSRASYIMDPGTMLLQYKLLFTEEKEMVTLISEQWSFRFNAMHYCQIFEKCITGIALWLIHFQPP